MAARPSPGSVGRLIAHFGIAQPVSYRFTDLPSFSVGSDPHNVTAFDGSDGRAYGVFVSGDLGTVAVVDLDKFQWRFDALCNGHRKRVRSSACATASTA
jgi:hypothetical protein